MVHKKKQPAKPKKEYKPGTAEQDPVVHVLLRVRSENGLTMTAHQEMIRLKGAALFGKVGQPLGREFREKLNQQIQRGVKTYLFLTTREGWNGPYVTFRCGLRQVLDNLGPDKRALVPTYYAFDKAVTTWFEITSIERLTREAMNEIFVMNSGRQLMSVIASSETVFGVVVRGASVLGTRGKSAGVTA
jgi:hypothetical protein